MILYICILVCKMYHMRGRFAAIAKLSALNAARGFEGLHERARMRHDPRFVGLPAVVTLFLEFKRGCGRCTVALGRFRESCWGREASAVVPQSPQSWTMQCSHAHCSEDLRPRWDMLLAPRRYIIRTRISINIVSAGNHAEGSSNKSRNRVVSIWQSNARVFSLSR